MISPKTILKPSSSIRGEYGKNVYDTLDRPLHDLRISVIDRCNFRCGYCMPKETHGNGYSFLKEKDWLTFKEIERLARLFAGLGVTKLRLTGGEPLLRPGLADLIRSLKHIKGIKEIALTTNGSLISAQAQALKDAGLNRITISLDTMDPEVFHHINGRTIRLNKVLEGISACEEADFACIKINAVLLKDVNDRQILDLVTYFKGRKPILRFIEYMDVGTCNDWRREAVIPASHVAGLINTVYPIRPVKRQYFGEVASRYEYLDGSGEVGFISSVTQPFCRSCTRARLSADGKLYTCLFAADGLDLRGLLRQEISDEDLLTLLCATWQKREDRYSELRSQNETVPQPLPKVEMFRIGG